MPQGGKVPNLVSTHCFMGKYTTVFKHCTLLCRKPLFKAIEQGTPRHIPVTWVLWRTGFQNWCSLADRCNTDSRDSWLQPMEVGDQLQQAFCTCSGVARVLSQDRDMGLAPTFPLGFFKRCNARCPQKLQGCEPKQMWWGNRWALVLDTSQHPFLLSPCTSSTPWWHWAVTIARKMLSPKSSGLDAALGHDCSGSPPLCYTVLLPHIKQYRWILEQETCSSAYNSSALQLHTMCLGRRDLPKFCGHPFLTWDYAAMTLCRLP